MSRVEVRPFAAEHIDGAAALLAARHRGHRISEPLLDPAYEAPSAAGRLVAELWADPDSSGTVALADGRLAGYLLGAPSPNGVWGPNIWLTSEAHAAATAETVRDLYAGAAQRWVDEGRIAHYAVVPAHDPAAVDAWFRLGFGQQQVHAVREAPPTPLRPSTEVRIRRAAAADIASLAALDPVLPQHQARSPVFSAGPVSTLAEALAEWHESVDDPAFTTFVAEHDGTVIGSAVGCDIRESRGNVGLIRPAHAGFLAFAAVHPTARGSGVGRALGEAVLSWAAQAGFPTVVTDWRATNLLSSRAWPRLGFRPAFLRLHRTVGH